MPKVNTYLSFDGTAAEAILPLQPSFFAQTYGRSAAEHDKADGGSTEGRDSEWI
jgi:hypothetical protein